MLCLLFDFSLSFSMLLSAITVSFLVFNIGPKENWLLSRCLSGHNLSVVILLYHSWLGGLLFGFVTWPFKDLRRWTDQNVALSCAGPTTFLIPVLSTMLLSCI